MKKKRPIYIIKIDDVPTEWTISYFIKGLVSRLSSLTYVHRIVDYVNSKTTTSIFIGLHDKINYLSVLASKDFLIHQHPVKIEKTAYISTSAEKLDGIAGNMHQRVPSSLKMIGLKPIYKLTSVYLLCLAEKLDDASAAIVGVWIMFDTKGHKARDFGFVSLLTPLAAQVQANTTIVVDLLPVRLEIANHTPIVVTKLNEELIGRRPLTYNFELNAANCLLENSIEYDNDAEASEPPSPALTAESSLSSMSSTSSSSSSSSLSSLSSFSTSASDEDEIKPKRVRFA